MKSIPDASKISWNPRDLPRVEGNLEGREDGFLNSYLPSFDGVHSLLINPSLGMYQEIHPSRPISIDIVKINPALVMLRE